MIVCQTKVTLLSYVMYFFIRLSYFICCYIRNCTNIVFIFHSFIEHIRLTLHFQMKGWFTILFKCICMTIANIVILYTGWYMILHHANHHSSCECHSSFEWHSSYEWHSSFKWLIIRVTRHSSDDHHTSDHSSCEWSLIMLVITPRASDRVTLVIRVTHHSSDSSFEWRSSCKWSLVMRMMIKHSIGCSLTFEITLKLLTK